MPLKYSKDIAAIAAFSLVYQKVSMVLLGILFSKYPACVNKADLKYLIGERSDEALGVQIHRLRSNYNIAIETVQGEGYRLTAQGKKELDELCQQRLSHLLP